MIDSATDPVWFFWPVTFAIVAAIAVHRLLRRRASWSAVVAVVSVAVPVLPFILAIPIRCSDEDAVLDLRIGALGFGLLGIVGWLAILARLQERAGDTRADAERRILWSGALLVPGMLVEFVVSAVTLAVRCTGTSEPVIAHLAATALVFTMGAGSALLRRRVDHSPRRAPATTGRRRDRGRGAYLFGAPGHPPAREFSLTPTTHTRS